MHIYHITGQTMQKEILRFKASFLLVKAVCVHSSVLTDKRTEPYLLKLKRINSHALNTAI